MNRQRKIGAAIAAAALAGTAIISVMYESEPSRLEYVETLVDTSMLPPAQPSTPRSVILDVATWQGQPYIYFGTGNGISVFTPGSKPGARGVTFCSDPPADHDWVGYSASVCDECEYGAAFFWDCNVVVWRVGPGMEHSKTVPETSNYGVFTYARDGNQYLITKGLSDDNSGCGLQFRATIYRIDSPHNLVPVGCLPYPMSPSGGVDLGSHLYLADEASSEVRKFAIIDGWRLQHEGVIQGAFANNKFGKGLRTDGTYLITGATASGMAATLWDVSSPEAPSMVMTFPDAYGATRVAIGGGIVWLGQNAALGTWTYDISNPGNPVDIAGDHWGDHLWNSQAEYPYLANSDAVIVGSSLYVARYSVLQEHRILEDIIFEDGFESGDTREWSNG